jgi:hypothetical protein
VPEVRVTPLSFVPVKTTCLTKANAQSCILSHATETAVGRTAQCQTDTARLASALDEVGLTSDLEERRPPTRADD